MSSLSSRPVRVAITIACLMFGGSTFGQTGASPMTLALPTITGDLAYFAGEYVRIPAARVRDVISPRLFTVEPAATPRSYMHQDRVLALVVASATSPAVTKGQVVEILGRPWTFAGAQTRLGGAWMTELDDDRKEFEHRAVIEAETVRVPGGVAVVSGASPVK